MCSRFADWDARSIRESDYILVEESLPPTMTRPSTPAKPERRQWAGVILTSARVEAEFEPMSVIEDLYGGLGDSMLRTARLAEIEPAMSTLENSPSDLPVSRGQLTAITPIGSAFGLLIDPIAVASSLADPIEPADDLYEGLAFALNRASEGVETLQQPAVLAAEVRPLAELDGFLASGMPESDWAFDR